MFATTLFVEKESNKLESTQSVRTIPDCFDSLVYTTRLLVALAFSSFPLLSLAKEKVVHLNDKSNEKRSYLYRKTLVASNQECHRLFDTLYFV